MPLLLRTLVCAGLLLLTPAALAGWAAQPCPGWATALSSRMGSPEGAALVFARNSGVAACIGVSMACNANERLGSGGGPGHDFTQFFCTNVQNCNVGTTGTQEDTSVAEFGNDLVCAYFVSGPDPRKNVGCPPPEPSCTGGNPINGGTGNKFQVEVDFAKVNGLEFVRTYNSALVSERTQLGLKWRHNWDRSVFAATTVAQALRGDGRGYQFTMPASGSVWRGDLDVLERLEKMPDGSWKLTTAAEEVEVYDRKGRLASVTSPQGEVTTLAYSDGTASGPNGGAYEDLPAQALASGLLLRVTDFRGRSLQFRYRFDGTLSRMIDPAGQVYQYTVGGPFKTLTAVTYPTGRTRTYLYNEAAHTTVANFPKAALTGIVDEKGARYSTYKYQGDLATSTELAGGVYKYAFSYGATPGYVDPLGTSRATSFATTFGTVRNTSTVQPCVGCASPGATESYTLDANGNATSRKDFKGNLTCRTFDLLRNLEIERTEGLSGSGSCTARQPTSATRTVSTQWLPARRLPKRMSEPLRITTYEYHGEPGVSCAPAGASQNLLCRKTVQPTTDADGAQTFLAVSDGPPRDWTYTYNAAGQVLTVNGPRTDVSDVTTYSYYASDDPAGAFRAGDLASITNALGHVTVFAQYDGAGRLRKSIDPNGLETLLDYWPRGWLKSRQAGAAAAGYETTTFDYDDNGSLTRVTMPDGSFVGYAYDDAHRLTRVNDGIGNRIEYALDNMGNRTAESAYDNSGTLVRVRTRVFDALGRLASDIGGSRPATQVTRHTYDAIGNLETITDPLSRVTRQIHDARNRLAEVRDPFNGAAAPTRYEYDGLDSLTRVTDPDGLATLYTHNGMGELLSQSSPDTGTTTFTYDEASNVKTRLDARGVLATYAYDALNRLSQIAYPDETVTYTYDSCANGIGRLCGIADKTGNTSYAYDPHGRITQKSQSVDSLVQTMRYAYNGAGQLAAITTPSGRLVEYGYVNNRPALLKVNGTLVLDSVLYEPFGPNGGWRWGNSSGAAPNFHTRLFDRDFRTTRVTSDLPAITGGAAAFDRIVAWDDLSRVASIADPANAAFNATYGYDALDRVASAAQAGSSWGYTYNGTGDRLTSTVNGAPTSYGYFAGSHRLMSLSGAQARSYTVDAAGNRVSDGSVTWTYGGNNRPTRAGSVAFAINALGQRVKKAGASGATRFVYDEAGRLWGEYDDSGGLVAETIWLEDLPVAVVK